MTTAMATQSPVNDPRLVASFFQESIYLQQAVFFLPMLGPDSWNRTMIHESSSCWLGLYLEYLFLVDENARFSKDWRGSWFGCLVWGTLKPLSSEAPDSEPRPEPDRPGAPLPLQQSDPAGGL